MYNGISIISEPWTFINKNQKIIQIIRPRFFSNINFPCNPKEYEKSYVNLVKNVDISACGVILEKKNNTILLKESCQNAILHCLCKYYDVNESAILYNYNRTLLREYKLKDRGWKKLKNDFVFLNLDKNKHEQSIREMKLLSLEFNPEYDYKIWTKEDKLKKEENIQDFPF